MKIAVRFEEKGRRESEIAPHGFEFWTRVEFWTEFAATRLTIGAFLGFDLQRRRRRWQAWVKELLNWVG
ncbi:hypothetical protein KY290_037349 [Solanum tuberosum]|uniref:Uncharacterized protein n=1 Tax=Solanum tuberosum TaxID=4113 RepID=A0ABQ7TWJ3_SOLTU|nr:hypothetical protein KY284_036691 [Solanum tuberosum]KAH0640062.1 hypothetical protein KY285_036648 [Solanum tuberosum]KAH0738644.1 hypothetical protein KY290_037349 [Solanum tuberosum]